MATLGDGIASLQQSISEPYIIIDLVCQGHTSPTQLQAAEDWLAINDAPSDTPSIVAGCPIILRKRELTGLFSHAIGELSAAITVIIMGNEALPEHDKELLFAFAADSACLFLIHDTASASAASALQNGMRGNNLQCETLDIARLEKGGFEKLVSMTDFSAAMSGLYNFCCSKSVNSIHQVIKLGIEQERRTLRAKQAVNNKQVLKLQSEKRVNTSDVFNELKKTINNNAKFVYKGLEDALQRDLESRNGAFASAIDQLVAEIEELQEIKRAKDTGLKIPDGVESQILEKVNSFFLKTGHQQIGILHDSARQLNTSIDNLLEKEGIAPLNLSLKFLTDQKLRELIQNSVYWDKVYEGSTAKKGAYEYFMAMRKYQMIGFLVVSTFGLSVVKNMRTYMIPISILLLGIGAYFVHKNVLKESAEKEEKEILKARESALSEVKRMASDFSRAWSRVVRDFLDSQEANLIRDIEQHLKNSAVGIKRQEEEDKNTSQRQSQALDNHERKLQALVRFEEDLGRQIERLKGDIRVSFKESWSKCKL